MPNSRPDVFADDQSNQDAGSDSTDASTLAAVDAKLAVLRGDVPEENNDVDETPVDDQEPVTEPDQTDADDTDSDKSDAGDDTDSEAADDDLPMLPSGHRLAALAKGYTTEEVDHFLKTHPDEAMGRFGELFDERKKESAMWSDRGRRLAQTDQSVVEPPKVLADPKDPAATPLFVAKALAEEFGNEDLINALVPRLNTMIEESNTLKQERAQTADRDRKRQESYLLQVTDEFFGSKAMEPSKETYGTGYGSATEEQMTQRMKLLNQADEIAKGAADHGREIPDLEALERAHMILSQGSRDEIIRQGIRDELKQRTKTTKSSHRKIKSSEEEGPVSEAKLEKRVAAKQRELRNK